MDFSVLVFVIGNSFIINQVIIIPASVTNRASSLFDKVRVGSSVGVISNQLRVAPPEIAPIVSHIAGEVRSFDIFVTL